MVQFGSGMAFGGNLNNVKENKSYAVYQDLVACMEQEFDDADFIRELKERIDLDRWCMGSHMAIGADDDEDDEYIEAIRATYQEAAENSGGEYH